MVVAVTATRAARSRSMLYALIVYWAFSGGAAVGIVQTDHQNLDLDGQQGRMVVVDSMARLKVPHEERPLFRVEEATESAEGALLEVGAQSSCPDDHDEDDDDDDDDDNDDNVEYDDDDVDDDDDDDDDDDHNKKCGKPVACTVKINKEHVQRIALSGKAELRISNVCPEIPKAELLVQPVTPNTSCPNTLFSKSVEIIVKANMAATFNFTFVSNGTYTPLEIGSFYI